MSDFFQTYFVEPIIYNTGYNVVNTTAYALMLVAAVIAVFKLLKKLDVCIDKHFFIGITPFIALGGILRAWEDLLESSGATAQFLPFLQGFILVDAAGVPRNLLLISPLVYITVFAVSLAALMVALAVQKGWKIHFYKVWFSVGSVIVLLTVSQLSFVNLATMLLMLAIASAWALAFFAAARNIKTIGKFFTHENHFIMSVHMFDASTTFVALQFFPYFEQHVLPGFLISVFGPAAMFALKLVVVSLVLYYLDKDFSEDRQKKNFIKIVILILGLGPGLRNFLRLGMGV
jgi:uncharacterized membrane protein